jgi:chromosome condensin MukBEF ATPase and DNA-binding subunit MukB
MLYHSITVSRSLQAQQQETQSQLRLLQTKLSAVDKVMEKMSDLERAGQANAVDIRNTLTGHSEKMVERSESIIEHQTKQFSKVQDNLAEYQGQISAKFSQQVRSVEKQPSVSRLKKEWRLLTIISRSLDAISPANSPYVPAEEKTSINKVADKLGGKANGCIESV